MNKYLVPYDVAIKLKELGFKENCVYYYEGNILKVHTQMSGWDFNTSFKTCCSVPLKSQVFEWAREKYDLFHCIEPHFSSGFNIYVKNIKNDKPYKVVYKTYEEAESACIDKLIEIIKEKRDE